MQEIRDRDAAFAVLTDPNFEVPPVPAASAGVAWLRATVGRFSTGATHERRRALSAEIIDRIPPADLAGSGGGVAGSGGGVAGPGGGRAGAGHPVAVLARAMGVDVPIADLVRDVAQAYQPGTGDEARADPAVERLVRIFGGAHDERTAAHIGVLVQACDATAALAERVRHRPLDEVLRDDPPVPATRRRARTATTVGGIRVEAGEVVLVRLAGDLAFGAGPRECPGRALALALAAPARRPGP